MDRLSGCKGAFLGLAVGDAMGFPVDEKTFPEIQEDYGPNGLLGYDLANGTATGSAYTQVAAYAANGFLLGITRGKPELYLRYVNLSLKEWARAQHFPRDPEKSLCWVAKLPQMRVRRSKDLRMLDALRMETPGTPEKPVNRAQSTGSLPVAAVAAIACTGRGYAPGQAAAVAARAVALTHGAAETFLSGAFLGACIAGILQEPGKPLQRYLEDALEILLSQFSIAFPQTQELERSLRRAMAMGQRAGENAQQEMESFRCDTAAACLQGAVYAVLAARGDFDGAMILAVNHSGKSAATASIAGAILGAYLGAEALPEFYLESLEAGDVLCQLSEDLALGSPTSGLFDDDWDQKYVQGLPVR